MVAGVFVGTLIVVSVITVRISDMILDSRIGALDRTLGFLFGLARGLLIVVVAFLSGDRADRHDARPGADRIDPPRRRPGSCRCGS